MSEGKIQDKVKEKAHADQAGAGGSAGKAQGQPVVLGLNGVEVIALPGS